MATQEHADEHHELIKAASSEILAVGIGLAQVEHADAEELRALEAREGGTFFWLGAIGAALAYVPLLNLFAPALTGLLFVHAGLEALRRLRLERGAWIVEMDLPKGKR